MVHSICINKVGALSDALYHAGNIFVLTSKFEDSFFGDFNAGASALKMGP